MQQQGVEPVIDLGETAIPKLFARACDRWPDRIAIRHKNYGIWQGYTWRQYYDIVKHFALGLISAGLRQGNTVMMIGNPEPEWVFACFATVCARGVATGTYQDSGPDEIAYVFNQSDSVFAVVEDQEQVDKVLQIADQLPKLLKIIYWDDKGMRSYADPRLARFQDVIELGRTYSKEHPGLFERLIAETTGDDPFGIWYTSGTTGRPKGAVMTNRNYVALAEIWKSWAPATPDDQYFARYPLCWPMDLFGGCIPAFTQGYAVSFPEEPATVQRDLREIGPHKVFVVPRLLEAQLSEVQVRLQDATFIKKLALGLFMPVGRKLGAIRIAGKKPNLLWRILGYVASVILFRPIIDQMGYSNNRLIATGGAAISAETFEFLLGLGLNVKILYGMLECTLVTVHKDQVDPETAGEVTSEWGSELKITEEGEICVRGPQRTAGYYNMPDVTARTIDEDGWLHTGDAGYLNERNHLVVLDRITEMGKLADGSTFSPQYIETKLKFSPYIRDAVVVGDGQEYIGVLVSIDFPSVAHYAEKRCIPFTNFANLSQQPQVHELIRQELRRLNERIPEMHRIRRFIVLPKELDADDAELTRTRKLRRGVVTRRYAAMVEALYGDKSPFLSETEVLYRDGRRAIVQVPVVISAVEDRQGKDEGSSGRMPLTVPQGLV